MKLHIALLCHNYQHRLCWMLSSIVQQSCSPMDLIVDIACLRENGLPSTENIAGKFNKIGLDVRLTHIDDRELFARRGLVRNVQIHNALDNGRDYVWFADADHVYHPDLFKELIKWLKNNGRNHHACIFSREKQHTSVKETNRLMQKSILEMPYIKNAFTRASELPMIEHIDKNQLAPGNMQIVSMGDLINLAQLQYADPETCKDKHMFKKGQRAWSDMQFRIKIGASKAIQLPMQIHLNHLRDKEVHKHLEVQR